MLWFTRLCIILLATGRDPARERLLENEKNNFKLVAEKVRYIEAVHVTIKTNFVKLLVLPDK